MEARTFDSGDLRYRTSLSLDGGAAVGDVLDTALLKPLVYINVNMMDLFIPAIMAVAYGQTSPVVALAAIEDSPTDPGDQD